MTKLPYTFLLCFVILIFSRKILKRLIRLKDTRIYNAVVKRILITSDFCNLGILTDESGEPGGLNRMEN